MAIIVDVVILAIMAICIFSGYRKGLLGVAVNILGFFIALIIALILYRPISSFIINNTEIETSLEESIRDTVTAYVISSEDDSEEVEDNSSKVISDYINNFIEEEKQKVEQTEVEIINNVSEQVATNIVKVAVAIGVYIIAQIILSFVKVLADLVAKLPIIGQFDKLGGVIYGVLKGLIIIYVILAIISLFATTMENSALLEGINSSILCNMMYNNNIILKIVF